MILTHVRHWRALAVCAVLTLIAGFALQSAIPAQSLPNPATIVKPETFVSVDKVPRGQTFEAAVVVEIAKGFHMNSNKPSEDYLIPTTITPNPPAGFRLVDTTYPEGQPKTFSFSPKKPLSVYTDTVTLRLKLAADAAAPLGATSIPATLRYQACNDTACLPPVRVPVTLNVEVAAAGTPTHHVHSEVFSATGAKN
jgi:DsbC/DsbD-like thiol-disulfide interchange protein